MILAIDCSLRWINIGLGNKEGLIGEMSMCVGRGQSKVLPEAAASTLARHNLEFSDIADIAATVGPGYYTGIRVGLAYAAALAESLGIGVIPMTSLFAMAACLADTGLAVAPVIRARSGAVYSAVYSASRGQLSEILAPSYYDLPDFVRELEKLGIPRKDLLIAGADALCFEEIGNLGYTIISAAKPSGAAMIAAAGNIDPADPAKVEAVYLRKPG